MSRAATRAIAALIAAKVPHEVLRYQHEAGRDAFGEEAVEHLAAAGVVPEQIYKTLIVAVPRGLAVAVLPVPAKLSLKATAAALGVAKAAHVFLADPAAAQRATGYVLGGISPFGQRKALPTVVDSSALGFEKVLCSAGQRGWDVAVAPADLIRLTGAVVADIRAR